MYPVKKEFGLLYDRQPIVMSPSQFVNLKLFAGLITVPSSVTVIPPVEGLCITR